MRALAEECFWTVTFSRSTPSATAPSTSPRNRERLARNQLFRIGTAKCRARADRESPRARSPLVQPNFATGGAASHERRRPREARWSNRYRTLPSTGLPCIFVRWDAWGPLTVSRALPITRRSMRADSQRPCLLHISSARGGRPFRKGIEAGRLVILFLDGNPITEDPDRIKVLGTIIDGRLLTMPTRIGEGLAARRCECRRPRAVEPPPKH
jgi:hypothetical protein